MRKIGKARIPTSTYRFGVVTLFILVVSVIPAERVRGESNPDRLEMIGSYLGLSEFCLAYGVDFVQQAEKIHNGLRDYHTSMPKDYAAWLVFKKGFEGGRQGLLYSPEVGGSISVLALGDPSLICGKVHQYTLQLYNLK